MLWILVALNFVEFCNLTVKFNNDLIFDVFNIYLIEGIGFDGTEDSTVEIVFFKKKSTPYTDKDFQMLPSYDVKANDLERERLIFSRICKKKGIDLQDE